jgi:hypothetical protein
MIDFHRLQQRLSPNMALQRDPRPSLYPGRSLGSPLNARPFGDQTRHIIIPSLSDDLSKEYA